MATHSSILAWRIPMDRGAWQLQSTGSQRVRHKRLHRVTKHNTQTLVKLCLHCRVEVFSDFLDFIIDPLVF